MRGHERVRVVVGDDHAFFRDGVERAVRERPEYELVASVRTGREALEAIREHEAHVAVLDVRMPDLDGLDVLRAVQRDGLPTRVLMLSAVDDPTLVYDAMAAGAGGYFSKDAERDDVIDAIAAVARGETRVEERLQSRVFEQLRARSTGEGPLLTAREREVLRLVADGLTAPAIARRLHLASPTVKTHLANLYAKLGVSDRAAAVAEAMRRGLLE